MSDPGLSPVEDPKGRRLGRAARAPRPLSVLRPALLPVVGLVGFVLLLLSVIWWGPSLLTRRPEVGGVDQHTAINGARTGLVALVAALGGVAGLLYTARTYRLGHRGQLADRYTRALDQLANNSSSVRIGAMYALGRIAQDNPHEYQHIVIDVLAAYIRDCAPWPRPTSSGSTHAGWLEQDPAPDLPSRDVEVAIAVLLPLVKQSKRKNLDLSSSNLAEVNFQEAHLLDARLLNSNLSGAKFNRTCLAGANFTGASLDRRTSFFGADLDGAVGLEHADRQLFEHAAVPPPPH